MRLLKVSLTRLKHNAKKICEACETLNDDKDISFFIIEATEGLFPEAPKQLELPLSKKNLTRANLELKLWALVNKNAPVCLGAGVT